jgi:gliding motility-associated-like protein
MMKILIRSLLLLLTFSSNFKTQAQCNWTQIYDESYEYTTAIPYLLPGTTYQNTPQQWAGCIRTGSYGMYMNIVDGYIGQLYLQPFQNMCVGQQYRFSFSTRDAFTSNNNLTISVKDANGVTLVTQNVINGSTWNDITMVSFTATTTTVTFEIATNLAGTGGNDVGFDDLKLYQCNPTPHNYSVTQCLSTPSLDLYNSIGSPLLSASGVWSGPSTLTNNHLGTFTSGINTNGLYTYTIDGAPGCADSVANLNVAFIQTPTLNPITNVITCSSFTLPAISGTLMSGNQKYSTGPGGTGTILNPGAIISTSQTIYVYDGAPGCDDQESFTITFNSPPVITVSANDTVCNGEVAQFTASSSGSGMTYFWTPGNLTGASISVTPSSSTIYSVVATDVNGCVSNIVSSAAIVRPKPTVTLQISNDSICVGDQVQLQVSSSVNGTTYQWNDGNTQAVRFVSPTSNTSYSVVGTSPNGCTDSKSGSVFVVPTLTVSISGTPTFCSGSSTTLTASGNIAGMTYMWMPTGSVNSSFTVTNSTIGWVYVEGSFFGCPIAIDSILTNFLPNPVITVPDDFEVCPGTAVVATVLSDVPNSNFVWMPGNLSGSTNTLSADHSTMYYVYAQNGNCISDIDSFYVDMSLVCNLEVPNIFSPNNDQTNDYFSLVSYSGIASLHVTISNRWGNLMAEFDKPDFKWNGKDQGGNDVPEGVYFYNITAKMGSGKDFNQQGFVHLIR